MKKYLFPFVLIITIISANIELDIYIPSFPSMIDYFNTTNSLLQWVLSINFIAMGLSGLIYGPLSDRIGRKKVIIFGLTIFVIGGFGCLFSKTIWQLLLWRFVQGLGCSAPTVIGFAIIVDMYKEREAAQFISILNSIITGSMACAPILGNWLDIIFGWKANFLFILVLSIVSLISTKLTIKETLPKEKRQPIKLKYILKDYKILLSDKEFIGLSIIPSLLYGSLIIYLSNLSLLFIKYLNVPQKLFGIYQGSVMGIFLLMSVVAATLIKKHGISVTQKLGYRISLVGASSMLIVSFLFRTSAITISISMMIFTAGTALSIGTYVVQALNCFPAKRGVSSALLGGIKLFITSTMITLVAYSFKGTIIPVSITIMLIMILISLIQRLVILDPKS